MYQTSREYKESMKRPIRNASYMKVMLGLINQEAQESASVTDTSEFAKYSDFESIYIQHTIRHYAAYEQNMFKADGSMVFLPRDETDYRKDGLISKELFDKSFVIKFEFGYGLSDIKGLTIQFGDNYPVKFRIITSDGAETEFQNNQSYFETDVVFSNTSSIQLIIEEMRVPNGRVRIDFVQFGLGLEYGNDWIIEANSSSSISAINEDLPESEFSVILNNEEQIFNVDNPSSAINFLESGQKIVVSIGYELDDESIEWMPMHSLYVYEWNADDDRATIKAVDVFKFAGDNYYKSEFYDDGISLYDLAKLVFEDAGIDENSYYIDPYLKNITVHNPIPNVPHKEALQIIANAGRCILDYDRSGKIRIYSAFIPDFETKSNGTTEYSDVTSIDQNYKKESYATYENNWWMADGTMLFIPKNEIGNTGYVSSAVSNNYGLFSENPIITRNLESKYKSYGMLIKFHDELPKKFIVRTYCDGLLNDSIQFGTCEKEYEIQYDFKEFDKIEVEFLETAAYSRIHVDYISLGSETSYEIAYDDLYSTPVGIQIDKIKNLNMSRHIYSKSTELTDITSDEFVYDGENHTYFLTDPSYGYTVSIENSLSGQSVSVVNSGAYYVEISISGVNIGDVVKLSIKGYKYNVSTSYYAKKINNNGEDKEWSNPLISDLNHCKKVAEWIADYYASGVEYELDYRGEPAVDVGDVIRQENKYDSNLKTVIEESQITFNGTLKGALRTRRKERVVRTKNGLG